jgi:glycosyltransferase involved in cell wall biosynthesis
LEAMACGKIVIGTNVGGIPDIITHGENGIMISPDDLPRLGEACLELINLPKKFIRKMGINARKTILNKFTISHESIMWIDIYKNLN